MRFWWTFCLIVAVVSLGGCTAPGDFCISYTEVVIERKAASALVAADRGAAEQIATNERLYDECK